MAPPFPYISGHLRRFLLEDPDVLDHLHGGRIGTGRVPKPLSRPYVRVAVSGQIGSTPRVRKHLVQVTPWIPEDPEVTGLGIDPAEAVWNLATVMGQATVRARNISIDEHTAWSALWLDGPIELFDTERGEDQALLYTPIVLEVTTGHRRPL